MANARETALLTLYKIEYEGAYSNIELKKTLSAAKLSQSDAGLVTALVYGILQRDITLEYVIVQYSSIKIKKISKYILIILKIGLYQILYMDKIPESAAVDECVKLAKKYGFKSSGFVNGVLRSFLRNEKKISFPTDKIEKAAAENSFPKMLAEEWINRFGYDFACELMKSLNEIAPMCVRVNLLKTDKEKMLAQLENAEAGKISPSAIYTKGFDVGTSSEYKEGLIMPQDEAAMLACEILAPKKGDVVIDLCAAPGGKTTYIAQLMENKGKILAFDIHEHKIQLITENAKRLGIDIISAYEGNSSEYNENYRECADCVLADVPCSGLGIIRKKPEIKKRYQKSEELYEIQYKILENAAKYLKIGGSLVYSTCTIETEENEKIISKFLKEHNEFETVDISSYFKNEKASAKKGYVTLYPNVDGTDGFFIAKLEKGALK